MAEHSIDKTIKELEKQIAGLKEEKQRYESQSPAIKLATYLHSTECHHNHIDACGWEYEKDEDFFKNGSRGPYYKRAKYILRYFEFDNVMEVLDSIEASKKEAK